MLPFGFKELQKEPDGSSGESEAGSSEYLPVFVKDTIVIE